MTPEQLAAELAYREHLANLDNPLFDRLQAQRSTPRGRIWLNLPMRVISPKGALAQHVNKTKG